MISWPRSTYVKYRELIALRLGIWALRTIYGECQTYIWNDFPGENLHCASCDATKVIRDMREMLEDA